MFCRNCGSKLRDNAKFCAMCGMQADFAPTAPWPPPPYNMAPRQMAPPTYTTMNSTINKINTGSIIITIIAIIACFLPLFDVFKSEPLNEVLDFFDFESTSFSLYTMMSIATKDEIWELLPDNIQDTISFLQIFMIVILILFIIIIVHFVNARLSINNNYMLNSTKRDYEKRKALIWLAKSAALLSLIEGIMMFLISHSSKGLLSLNSGFWCIILASAFCFVYSFSLNDMNYKSSFPVPVITPHNNYYRY